MSHPKSTRPSPQYSHEAYRLNKRGRKMYRWRYVPGIASEFIHHLPNLIERLGRIRVVLYCRESCNNGNLGDQKAEALYQLDKLGVDIVGYFEEVEGSSITNCYRVGLDCAIACAKEHDAVLVAYSRERIIRWDLYNGTNERSLPVVGEYRFLKFLMGDVLVATILHPDERERSKTTQRGQKKSDKKSGRPRKLKPRGKERCQAYLPMVMEMHEAGKSYEKIRDELNAINDGFPNVCHATVGNWIKAEKKRRLASQNPL